MSGPADGRAASVVAALAVYVEPLVADARVAVVGDGELGLHERLLELGARTVHLFDPDPERVARTADEVPRGVSVRMLRDDFDVRDGAFDLVIIPDVGLLPDPPSAIVRLRRVVDARGAVVALGRARTDGDEDDDVFPELAPAVVEYAELYDLFALQFESVMMTGVLPFSGVVFAELGAGEDLAVSVDTRLVDPEPPGVFVVVAGREATALDPYAIVQIARGADPTDTMVELVETVEIHEVVQPRELETAAAFAEVQLRADLLATQLEEHRARLTSAEGRDAEHVSLAIQLASDRDAAASRASELEVIVDAAQQGLVVLEKRLVAAEQGILERDDRIAALSAELDARASADVARQREEERSAERVDPGLVAELTELTARAERAEASLALHVADLAQLSDAHDLETSRLEEQLLDRARVIAATDKELARREQLVRELVTSLEDARDASAETTPFQAAPALPGVAPEEVARLRRKLDDLALEVARREGELVAQAWRITELENDKARLLAARPPANAARPADLERDLARVRDELDALRQALTQEHAARVAAESVDRERSS